MSGINWSFGSSESVKVIVRCRPINEKEIAMKCESILDIDSERCSCFLQNPSDHLAPSKSFTFDGVYNSNSSTEQIYQEIAYPLVESVLDGYNGTIFAYGQTGCGKSFTMQGIQEPVNQRGIIPRAFEHIFEVISLAESYKYLVLASYLEIYNEKIRDLLCADTKRNLYLKENCDRGVYVHDLSHHAVHDVSECQKLMELGWKNRSVGSTLMNDDSSRSHSIFTISVEMMPVSDLLKTAACPIRRGKLNLVDLAGSERQAKTGATGDRLKEATKINLSLCALGNVISALVDGKAKHIPYRDSKLTRLLQDSLGGNTKTLMIACLSPADYNYEETLSTLRYANRAKNICNQPRVNEDPKDTMLREYQQQILQLQEMLRNQSRVDGTSDQDKNSEYEAQVSNLKKKCQEEYYSKIRMQAHLEALKEQYQRDVLENESGSETELCSKAKESAAQAEIMERLEKLRSSMVGGERKNDGELKKKREKNRQVAERRMQMLAKAMATIRDDENENRPQHMMLEVYEDIQEELKVKADLLRKYKLKVKALDREIADLQSEFENERTDYLETIRKQERQLQLHIYILETLLPALSKECNYKDLESIKSEAKWCEDTQSWQLPQLSNACVKFPPAIGPKDKFLSQKTAPANLSLYSGQSVKKNGDFENGPVDKTSSSCHNIFNIDSENVVENYFKPRRAHQLLMQAKEMDGGNPIAKWKDCIQRVNMRLISNNEEDESVYSPTDGGKFSPNRGTFLRHQNMGKLRSWAGMRSSPIAWMTGNVSISSGMLPRGPISDLLPPVTDKRML